MPRWIGSVRSGRSRPPKSGHIPRWLGQLPKEEPHKDDAVELPLKELSASPKNAFRQLDEETYSELKASLQASGLVYPVIVRPRDSIQSYPINGEYEILAGHNRVRAARDLGWETIKASIVRVDDVQAVRIINDSNLQRPALPSWKRHGPTASCLMPCSGRASAPT